MLRRLVDVAQRPPDDHILKLLLKLLAVDRAPDLADRQVLVDELQAAHPHPLEHAVDLGAGGGKLTAQAGRLRFQFALHVADFDRIGADQIGVRLDRVVILPDDAIRHVQLRHQLLLRGRRLVEDAAQMRLDRFDAALGLCWRLRARL